MAPFSGLQGLRRSRLFRTLIGGSAVVGAAAGGVAAGAALRSGDGNASAEAAQPAAKAGVRQVSLHLEGKRVRVNADRSLLRDSLDSSSAGATSLNSTPNTPDNTGGAENTGSTPNTPDNTGGVDDSPSNTSSSVQGSSSGGGDGVSDGADDSPSNTS